MGGSREQPIDVIIARQVCIMVASKRQDDTVEGPAAVNLSERAVALQEKDDFTNFRRTYTTRLTTA